MVSLASKLANKSVPRERRGSGLERRSPQDVCVGVDTQHLDGCWHSFVIGLMD